MTSRLRLLNKLRSNITASAAASIYNIVIVPLFSYCSLLKPTLTQGGLNKKQIQLNLCNIFSISTFNELYLFV